MGKTRTSKSKAVIAEEKDTIPHLPLEIYSIISGFLVGDSKFGTAANLNVVSRAIHRETLPTLYETVLCDRGNPTSWVNKGFRYTKFLIFIELSPQRPAMKRTFPNLVMMVENRFTSECSLTIYRPVSLSVILDVLKTPMIHPPVDHKRCADLAWYDRTVEVDDGAGPLAECAEMIKKPNPRTVEAITKVHFMDDAHIQETPLSKRQCLRTTIRLHLSNSQQWRISQDERIKWLDKILMILRSPAPAAPRSDPLPTQARRGKCIYKRRNEDEELHLELSQVEADSFLRLLNEKAFAAPQILHHRISIRMYEVCESGYLSTLSNKMMETYETHFTSIGREFPLNDTAYSIFRCYGTEEEEEALPGEFLHRTFIDNNIEVYFDDGCSEIQFRIAQRGNHNDND